MYSKCLSEVTSSGTSTSEVSAKIRPSFHSSCGRRFNPINRLLKRSAMARSVEDSRHRASEVLGPLLRRHLAGHFAGLGRPACAVRLVRVVDLLSFGVWLTHNPVSLRCSGVVVDVRLRIGLCSQ